jgi:Domain of unknown function (DUF4440)
MKNTLITFLFSVISLCALAQAFPPFSEKTFNDMMGSYQKETAQFLKTQTAPDFIFVGTDNAVMTTKELLGLAEAADFLTNEFSNLKIRQYGNMAIVTGTWSHSHQLKQDKRVILAFKELVTEVFVTQSGKWMYVSHQSSTIVTPKADDEAAIKKAIENESSQFHINPDRNVFLQSWNMVDGTTISYSGKGGMTTLSGKDMKAAAEKGVIPKANGEVTTFSNYLVRANGNIGWATFDQTSAKGIVTHEFRCMEKVGNDWKIVSSSVHSTEK